MKTPWKNQVAGVFLMVVRFVVAGICFSSIAMADYSAFFNRLDIEKNTEVEGLLRLDGNGVFMDQQLRIDFQTKIKFKQGTTKKAPEDSETDLLDSFSKNTQSEAKSDSQAEGVDLLESFAGGTKAKANKQAEDADLLESFAKGTKTKDDSQAELDSFGEDSSVTEIRWPEFQLRMVGIFDPVASDHARENQVRFFSGGVTFFAGEQQSLFVGKESYIWGKADEINPLDVVNANDFTEFLMKDQNRRKVPRYLLKYNYAHEDDNFQFIFAPGYEPNVLPNKQSRWCQILCQIARPVDQPPTLTQPGITVFDDLNRSALKFSEYSMRYSSRTDWLDYSFVVHNGFDKYPVYKRTFTSPFTVNLERLLVRKWSFGSDFSFTISDFGIRVEALFQPNSLLHYSPNSNDFLTDEDGLKEVNQLNWIVGVDWTSSTDTYVNFQFAQSKFFDDNDYFRNIYDMVSTLQIAQRNFFVDDLEASVLFYYEYADNSYAIAPELSYQFNDQIALTLGGFYFGGNINTFFGQYKNNSNVFTKLVYAF